MDIAERSKHTQVTFHHTNNTRSDLFNAACQSNSSGN